HTSRHTRKNSSFSTQAEHLVLLELEALTQPPTFVTRHALVKKVVTHVHTWEGKIFLFEDVPADVCQQCGEIYFSPDILEVMDKIVTSDIEPKTKVAVPVFSISDAVQ